jgi:two-component system chemotaxis sensor kinase CheA
MTETGNLLVSHINIEQRLEQIKALHRAHHLWQRQWRRVHTEYIRLLRTTSQNPEMLALWQPMLDFLQESQQYMKRAGRDFQQLERSMNEDSLTLGLVTDTIQSGVRDMRLLPFESITGGLQRMVRDMARDLGKEVLFQTVGAHIQLDKHVLENLKDPLNHLLRNAIDHGIEITAEREAAGKYPKGMILVALARRGNAVSLTLSDDGRGIDHEQVREKALQIGLISPNEARTLTDNDTYDLLMQPGISTSPAVNEISGRGIGLDVVRQKVEALQGQLSIQSQLGEGTTFEIVLPVSLSTLHCILVRIGEETYAVPSNTIIRVFTYDTEQVFSARGRNMLTYGGRPIPLSALADVLERHHISYDEHDARVMILGTSERYHSFIVDDVIDEREVIVRNLNPELARVSNISHATVLGDGQVVLILNVSDLIKNAQGKGLRHRQPSRRPAKADAPPLAKHILVVDDSITTRTLQRNILEAAGYRVQIATHGIEALDKLETESFDLIITDIEMPAMDGFELTRRIRQHPNLGNLPIILVTSLDSQDNKERGFQAGADAYVVKGVFDQNELLEMIKTLL